jgi:hypothetical protein
LLFQIISKGWGKVTMFCSRGFLIVALMLIGTPAFAQSAQITKINVIGAGVIGLENSKTIKDASLSTGSRTESKDPKLLTATTTITGSTDLNFGIIFVPTGKPQDGIAAVRIKWLYPAPGMINPDTGAAKDCDEYRTTVKLGAATHLAWEVRREWQIVPGPGHFRYGRPTATEC